MPPPGEYGRAIVCCVRIADRPIPPVPSFRVPCVDCGAPCWMSKLTGVNTVLATDALNRQLGHDGPSDVVCSACIAAYHQDITMLVTPEVEAEARGHKS
jgi:hypothetical protein